MKAFWILPVLNYSFPCALKILFMNNVHHDLFRLLRCRISQWNRTPWVPSLQISVVLAAFFCLPTSAHSSRTRNVATSRFMSCVSWTVRTASEFNLSVPFLIPSMLCIMCITINLFHISLLQCSAVVATGTNTWMLKTNLDYLKQEFLSISFKTSVAKGRQLKWWTSFVRRFCSIEMGDTLEKMNAITPALLDLFEAKCQLFSRKLFFEEASAFHDFVHFLMGFLMKKRNSKKWICINFTGIVRHFLETFHRVTSQSVDFHVSVALRRLKTYIRACRANGMNNCRRPLLENPKCKKLPSRQNEKTPYVVWTDEERNERSYIYQYIVADVWEFCHSFVFGKFC